MSKIMLKMSNIYWFSIILLSLTEMIKYGIIHRKKFLNNRVGKFENPTVWNAVSTTVVFRVVPCREDHGGILWFNQLKYFVVAENFYNVNQNPMVKIAITQVEIGVKCKIPMVKIKFTPVESYVYINSVGPPSHDLRNTQGEYSIYLVGIIECLTPFTWFKEYPGWILDLPRWNIRISDSLHVM